MQEACHSNPSKYDLACLKSPRSSAVRALVQPLYGRLWIPLPSGAENSKNTFPFPFLCLFFPVSVLNCQSQCLNSHFSSEKNRQNLSIYPLGCKHWLPRAHLVNCRKPTVLRQNPVLYGLIIILNSLCSFFSIYIALSRRLIDFQSMKYW